MDPREAERMTSDDALQATPVGALVALGVVGPACLSSDVRSADENAADANGASPLGAGRTNGHAQKPWDV